MRILLCLALAACATDDNLDLQYDFGIYGRLSVANDTGGPNGTIVEPVALYRNGNISQTELALPDDNGIYQFPVGVGHYELCVRNAHPDSIYDQWMMNCAGKCVFIDITVEGDLVRADWQQNLSGGSWSAGDACPRR